jgi:hypothetical protein
MSDHSAAGGLLLALAVLFFATALRQAIGDEDAAAELAPEWLSRVDSTPGFAILRPYGPTEPA